MIDSDLQRQLGLTNNDQVLLFVGSLDLAHYFKGVDYLLQAVASLVLCWPQVKLLIIGDGNQKEFFKKQAEELKISQQIKFIGVVKQAELPRYYRLAKLFILPSVAIEAFPVVILEAMACGLPVVTTTLPGPADLVGEAGITVEPKNPKLLAQAISALLTDNERCQILSQKARCRVEENFTWPKIITNLKNIYINLLNQQ